MADAGLAAGWVLLLVAAVGGGARLRRWGMPAADVRDALHIGAGVWVLGWPLWSAWQVPLLIVTASVVSALMVPALTQRHEWARRLYESVAEGDERWSGVSLYIVAFATLTAVGLLWRPFPAAAALLALAWGDGPGSAVGRRFGKHHFRVPGGRQRSLEGSAAVAVGASCGVLMAGALFEAQQSLLAIALLGATAAVAEATSPPSVDNALVSASVFVVALFVAPVG